MFAPHSIMSPTRVRSLEPSSTHFNTSTPCLCQAICMVTILASHDRIFYLLAPLLYWSLSSRQVVFTVQGSRTACLARSLTHTSGCPVLRFLHHVYVSPWVATPLMLPSRPSLSKAWPAIPTTFCTGFYPLRYQDIYVPLGDPSLWSCGWSLARCLFHTCSRPWVQCHASSTPPLSHPTVAVARLLKCF